MNEELGASLVAEHPKATKFFQTNVLETESIAAAVKGSLAWIKETGFELGGVVAAAGVSTPAKVHTYALLLLPVAMGNIREEMEEGTERAIED